MNLAVEEAKGLPEYNVKGEVSVAGRVTFVFILIKQFVVGDHRCPA